MKTLVLILLLGITSVACVVTTEGPITGAKYDYDVLTQEVTINDAITVRVP